MTYNKKNIEDIQVSGKKVLVRCDFNVPLKDGVITSDKRIVEAIPTIKYLLDQGAAVILCSHMGKPKGEVNPKYTLAPVAARLTEILGQEVKLAPDTIGEETKAQISQMKSIVDAIASGDEYSADGISDMIGVDEQIVKSIFFIAQLKDASIMDITPIFWANVAQVLGMSSETIEAIFKVQPVQSLTFVEFIDIVTEVVGYAGNIVDAEQIDQLRRIVDELDIPVLCFGLRTDFLTHVFPGSRRLFVVADSISEIKTICSCGKKAIINARIDKDGNVVTKGSQVLLGGNDLYVAMCHSCWKRAIATQEAKDN